MEQKIYLDGKFVTRNEAKVSVFDHGLLYGDGVFEGIRAYGGKVFKLREHVDRLYKSAKAIMLEIPMDSAKMEETVLNTLRENGIKDGYVRVVVTRGEGDLGLDPQKCPRASVIVIADKIALYGDKLTENGIEIVTVATQRNLPAVLDPRVKSLNYLNNIMAKIEATNAGVMEALMVTREGYAAECTGDNIFIVTDGVFLTPPVSMGILEGITRNVVMELVRAGGSEARGEIFTRYDVYNSDECFVTGTAAEIIPVVKVDGRTIGKGKPGSATLSLIKKFRKLTAEEGTDIN
jgi:branched-chain amino acid aminotransferase